jgi:hypothetical protein
MKNVCQQVGGSHYTVREVLQELKYNYTKLPLGNAKAAPLQGIVEVAEHTRPKDEDLVAQLKGTPEFAEHSRTKDDCVKNLYNRDSSKSSQEIQDVDDVLISPNDAVTSTGIVEKVRPFFVVFILKTFCHPFFVVFILKTFCWQSHLAFVKHSIGQLNAWFSCVYV